VSVMLNVAVKSIIQSVYILSVVMLNVMAPLLGAYTTIPNRTGDQ
jgi:hypothetical protein